MRKNLKIILIAFVTLLIVASPVVAAENNIETQSVTKSIFDFDIWSWLFPPTVKVADVHIVKENYKHTYSNGKVDKSINYYLNFYLSENTAEELNVEVHAYDKSGNQVSFEQESITGSTGEYAVSLDSSQSIEEANLLIYNGNTLIINETTTTIEKTTDEQVDEPIVEKKAEDTSSSTKYWASSKSNKFHYPSCEWAQKISSKNKIVFSSRSEAINSGYVPCQVCGP